MLSRIISCVTTRSLSLSLSFLLRTLQRPNPNANVFYALCSEPKPTSHATTESRVSFLRSRSCQITTCAMKVKRGTQFKLNIKALSTICSLYESRNENKRSANSYPRTQKKKRARAVSLTGRTNRITYYFIFEISFRKSKI